MFVLPLFNGEHASQENDQFLLSMEVEDFKSMMQKFAVLVSSKGIRVIFQGTRAYCDRKTVYLPEPSIFLRKGMSPTEQARAFELLRVCKGNAFHEIFHILYTDFNIVETPKPAVENEVLNVFEDIRINRKGTLEYPGSLVSIQFMLNWYFKEIEKRFKTYPPMQQLMYIVTLFLSAYHYQDHGVWKNTSTELQSFVLSHESFLLQIIIAKNTKETWNLAKEFLALLSSKKEESTPKTEDKPKEKGEKTDGSSGKSEKDKGGKKEEEEEPGEGETEKEDSTEEQEESEEGEEVEANEGDSESEELEELFGDDQSPHEKGSPEYKEEVEDRLYDYLEKAKKELEEKEASEKGESTEEEGIGTEEIEVEESEGEPLTLDSSKLGKVESAASLFGHKVEDVAAKLDPYLQYIPFSTEADYVGPPISDNIGEEKAFVARLEQEAKFCLGTVERWLQGLLVTHSKSQMMRGQEEGDLDPSSLYKLAFATSGHDQLQNDARYVFQQEIPALTLKDTAVGMSLDISSSMGNNGGADQYLKFDEYEKSDLERGKIKYEEVMSSKYAKIGVYRYRTSKSRIVCMTALAFARALDLVKIPLEITSWSCNKIHKREEAVRTNKAWNEDPCKFKYARVNPLLYYVIKGFNEDWMRIKHRLYHVSGVGDNYDGEAVKKAAISLSRMPQKRKILFVLGDGSPAPGRYEDINVHSAYLKTVIAEIRKETNIELIGFSICDDSALQYYKPHAVMIEDQTQVPTVVIQQLKKILLPGVK